MKMVRSFISYIMYIILIYTMYRIVTLIGNLESIKRAHKLLVQYTLSI